MNGDEPKPQSFSWARRWSAGLNFLVSITAVVALVAMINYLSIRHYTRFHWNRNPDAELSKRTLYVLASLTNAVKIICYYDSEDPLFPRVKGLLREYQYASPRIQLQFVDYIRDGSTARAIKDQYKLNAVTDKDLIIFDSNGNQVVKYARDLSDYDTTKLISGETNEVYRTHFKGELLFTSGIFSVANARKPVAYFLLGHNEHPPGGADNESYGKFCDLLMTENNFEMRPLLLSGTNEIPPDCNLLIVAGPTNPLDRGTLDNIQGYLEQGGRLLATFTGGTERRRATGLEQLLRNWGVDVTENVVVDFQHSTSGGLDVVPIDVGRHPIVNPLQNSQVQLYMPRSIRALKLSSRSDELKVDEMLFTGPETLVLNGRTPDPTQKGRKALMAVVEKSVAGLQRGSTRLVVLGDSMLWDNQMISSGVNAQLAESAANWLVNETVLLNGIDRQAIRTFKLTMTRAQLRSVQLILLAGMPGAVLFVGLVVWFRRRN